MSFGQNQVLLKIAILCENSSHMQSSTVYFSISISSYRQDKNVSVSSFCNKIRKTRIKLSSVRKQD